MNNKENQDYNGLRIVTLVGSIIALIGIILFILYALTTYIHQEGVNFSGGAIGLTVLLILPGIVLGLIYSIIRR